MKREELVKASKSELSFEELAKLHNEETDTLKKRNVIRDDIPKPGGKEKSHNGYSLA